MGPKTRGLKMTEISGSIGVYAQMGLLPSHPQTPFKVTFPPVNIVSYYREVEEVREHTTTPLIGQPITLN